MEDKRSNNKRKKWYRLGLGVVTTCVFASLLGVFSSDLNVSSSKGNALIQPTKTFANTISNNSLNDYWNNLESVKLVNSKETLNSFINQNGAIFENLIASKDYIATGSINELVSTNKSINYVDNDASKTKIKNLFKSSVQGNAQKLYDFGSKEIKTAAEYVARMNALNDIYPEFKKRYVDDYGQALGIWSNPFNQNYDNGSNTLVDAPAASWGDALSPVYLRENYRKYFVDKASPTYSSFLYNNLAQSIAHEIGWKSMIMGRMSDGLDFSNEGAISSKTYYVADQLLTALSWYSNDFYGNDKVLETVLDEGKDQTSRHWSKRYDYIWAAALILGPLAVVGIGLAASRSPDKWYSDQSVQDFYWDEGGMTTNHLINTMIGSAPRSIEGNLSTKIDTLYNTSSVFRQLRDEGTAFNWNVNSPRHYMNFGLNTATDYDKKINGKRGKSKADAELEFLTDIYFDKVESEWRGKIEEKQGGDDLIFFDDFINTNDGLYDQMNDEGYKIFQLALKDYFLDISEQSKKIIKSNSSGFTKNNGIKLVYLDHLNPFNAANQKERRKIMKAIQPLFTEENKRSVFKKHLDKYWAKYKSELDVTIDKKLESTKRNAKEEFEEQKKKLEAALITPYTDANFKVHDYVQDTLGQKSIPAKYNGEAINFAIIPENNSKSSPYGFDKNAQDITNSYLTKNIVLRSFLDRKSELASLLKTKSPASLRAYVTSLFAKFQSGIYDKIEPIYTQYSTQTNQLFEDYLTSSREGINRDLTKEEYKRYSNTVLLHLRERNRLLMDLDLNQVKLAKGFLLSILDVTKYNDPSGKYKTIFEMIDENKELNEYIKSESVKLAKS